MLHSVSALLLQFHSLPLAVGLIHPAAIVALCIIAGVGTVMMLPGRRDAAIVKMGALIALSALLILAALLARTMAGVSAYFWIFSGIAVASALRLITHTKAVYSAMYFVLSVLSTAGLFVLLWAEFMAAALVLIYAGAILVTYVFVIMLASQVHSGLPGEAGAAEYDLAAREPVAASVVGFALMAVLLFVIFERAGTIAPRGPDAAAIYAGATGYEPPGTTQRLGLYIFEHHMVSVQLAGILMTVAMVGAIVIARRRVPRETLTEPPPEMVTAPATPIDDDPHSILVTGTENPRQKQYPET